MPVTPKEFPQATIKVPEKQEKPTSKKTNKEAKTDPKALGQSAGKGKGGGEKGTPDIPDLHATTPVEPIDSNQADTQAWDSNDWTNSWQDGPNYWYGSQDWSWGHGSSAYWRDWQSSWDYRKQAESKESLGHVSCSTDSLESETPVPETPQYKQSQSLDSEMAACLSRLSTVDRKNSFESMAQDLAAKFDSVKTPDKKPGTSGTPTTSPGPTTPSPAGSASTGEGQAAEKKGPTQDEPKKCEQGVPAVEEGNDKAEEKLKKLQEKKKAAHARYMRYYRSVHGTRPRLWSLIIPSMF